MAAEVMIIYKVLAAVASIFGLLMAGHAWWLSGLKKSIETRLHSMEVKAEELRVEQTRHANIFITEQRTREVFREEIAPLKDDINGLKTVISDVRGVVMGVMDKVSALVTEVRIINAVKESKEKN